MHVFFNKASCIFIRREGLILQHVTFLHSDPDPFFSANTGLFENLNIPWYCFFNDLSRKTGLNQIKKLFRTVHRGQRSKKVIFDKNSLFQNIYFIFSAESTSKLELIMLPYTLVTSYVIDSTIIDHTLGQRSN